MKKKLYIVLQPLQYLQISELFCMEDANYLVVLNAHKNSQLNNIINDDHWNEITRFNFSGTLFDLIKNRSKISEIINSLAHIDEIYVSSYYNEFMNFICNAFSRANITLLEDGNANLLLKEKIAQKNFRQRVKTSLGKVFGLDISAIKRADLYTIYPEMADLKPDFVNTIILNTYSKVKQKVTNFKCDNKVYFVSSNFVGLGMISIDAYVDFIVRLSKVYPGMELVVVLHRFDVHDGFRELLNYQGIAIAQPKVPIELFFLNEEVSPHKIITAGSGATDTLKAIYDYDIELLFPDMIYFKKTFRADIKSLKDYYKNKFDVSSL